MLDRWVFQSALLMIIVSIILYIVVMGQQLQAFQKARLKRLKWYLLGAVFLLIVGAVPLGLEYANILWFHNPHTWTINLAVLTNSAAKVVVGILLIQIYRYRSQDDDLIK